jgi:hypothetical protein
MKRYLLQFQNLFISRHDDGWVRVRVRVRVRESESVYALFG